LDQPPLSENGMLVEQFHQSSLKTAFGQLAGWVQVAIHKEARYILKGEFDCGYFLC
jgi:hypothetical protein